MPIDNIRQNTDWILFLSLFLALPGLIFVLSGLRALLTGKYMLLPRNGRLGWLVPRTATGKEARLWAKLHLIGGSFLLLLFAILVLALLTE
jgi:uncharacterized iron-regulated membrane protein